MFDELFERAARSERGHSDNRALDRFRQDDAPLGRRRWAAYVNAEIRRRLGRLGDAVDWLAAAPVSTDAPVVWQAEMASCHADLELGFDEPARALPMAERSWRHWLEVPATAMSSENDFSALLAEIDLLFTELCRVASADAGADPMMKRSAWVSERLIRCTLSDASRLIRLAGALGDLELARTATFETIEWLERAAPCLRAVSSGEFAAGEHPHPAAQAILETAFGPVLAAARINLLTQLGDSEDACRKQESAKQHFDEAARLAREMRNQDHWSRKVLELETNSANQLAKLRRYDEAQRAYERVLDACRDPELVEIAVTCRFGINGCQWRRSGGSTALEDHMALVGELEGMFLAKPTDPWTRAMLLSAYSLLLSMIVADRQNLPQRLRLLLEVLYAIRSPEAVAMFVGEEMGDRRSARFNVDVLLSRWAAQEGAVLLVLEAGADDLVLATLESGTGPLDGRMQIGCIAEAEVESISNCIAATREASDQISMRMIGLKRGSPTAMEAALSEAWSVLPVDVRDTLVAANTIYFSPANQTAIDEFPLEALHDDEGFLGARTPISRVPSLRHLNDLLAGNRYRQTPPARAVLVEANDPQRGDTDLTVKQQAALIADAIDGLELELEHLHEPSADAFAESVGAPAALLHFVGHGFADEGGEVLVLSESEQVPIADVLAGTIARAPFTYFSACEVGRGRQMSTGAQRGLAAAFLGAGAPAIVAPTYRIPSHFLGLFAALFYQYCAELPAGQALAQTRRHLDAQQYHPACWATVTLFGDASACLTGEAAAAHPRRPPTWKDLVFQHRATQDPERAKQCLHELADDPAPDSEVKRQLTRWLEQGTVDREQVAPLLARLRDKDAEAAALMGILWTIDDVRGVTTESPQSEQDDARTRLRRCLITADVLADSYAAVCVIEAIGNVGVPMNSLGSYRDLLAHEHALLERLSDDAPALAPIAEPLAKRRDHLGTMTFINLGDHFGYSDEDIAAADGDDPAALRRVALDVLERSAQPEVLAGVWPWYVWLLLWGGTGTESACGDVLAALKIDVKAGRLSERAAAAIRAFVGEVQFSSPLDMEVVTPAFEAVEPGSVEFHALYLLWLKDEIEYGSGSVSGADAQQALAVAEQLDDALGPTGITAWYRTVLAETCLAVGELTVAGDYSEQAIDELAALNRSRPQFTRRLARAVRVAIAVADAELDEARSRRLRHDFADVLAAAASPEDGAPQVQDQFGAPQSGGHDLINSAKRLVHAMRRARRSP